MYKAIIYRYGKLPAKVYEEIPCNKLYVDLISPCVIQRKLNKENLKLKAVTMIDIITGWPKKRNIIMNVRQ